MLNSLYSDAGRPCQQSQHHVFLSKKKQSTWLLCIFAGWSHVRVEIVRQSFDKRLFSVMFCLSDLNVSAVIHSWAPICSLYPFFHFIFSYSGLNFYFKRTGPWLYITNEPLGFATFLLSAIVELTVWRCRFKNSTNVKFNFGEMPRQVMQVKLHYLQNSRSRKQPLWKMFLSSLWFRS